LGYTRFSLRGAAHRSRRWGWLFVAFFGFQRLGDDGAVHGVSLRLEIGWENKKARTVCGLFDLAFVVVVHINAKSPHG